MDRLSHRTPDEGGPGHLELGRHGETAALGYLKARMGYRVVATNFRVGLGRGLGGRRIVGEIDIICYDGETLVFVEVKTRSTDEIMAPEGAVGLRKQRQIARAARRYRQLMRITGEPYRYDVVSIVFREGAYKIELLKNFFDDRVFRRSRFFGALSNEI